ncbi:flavohemoglobin expression-modulating QEGLA motif protein [Litorimonas sp. WD9-15]|uniref:flavohemoglobin expression-modulating QEGLA motif protein n=1 Tax=Litorimonas sp. WD9-15 TaxID=3418716 RepID=UPI003D0444B7
MTALSEKQFEAAKTAAAALDDAAGDLRVLSSLNWDNAMREPFLTRGVMPAPDYPTVDTSNAREAIAHAKTFIDGDHVVMEWLNRLCTTLDTTASLIETRGTKEFFHHSAELYGRPTRIMLDKQTRVLDLAEHMDATLAGIDFDQLVVQGYEGELDAEEFAEALEEKLEHHFGKDAPNVLVSDKVTAKAAASSTRIRVRSDAEFTHNDVDQLLHHEALIHSATGMNGKLQENFPILGRGHPGTTEIQEGLAVFAEIITGNMDPRRFRRLSGRVMAIQMTIDGADFKEVFDWFVGRGYSREQAYENTRRIFRGGVMTGGAPFTKDMVYLNGLLRVHNFIRSVVKIRRADLIRVLFVGKLDVEDIPALSQLASMGRIDPPKFMPPWAKDLRFLVSYMAYSAFLNQVKMPGFQAYYEKELDEVPDVWAFADGDPET